MLINNVFRSKVLVVGVLAAFVLLVAPVREFAQSKAPVASGSLVGFIYDKDMKTPISTQNSTEIAMADTAVTTTIAVSKRVARR